VTLYEGTRQGTSQQGDLVETDSGGDYVDPVQATVMALTAKRVKIEADDDRDIVIRLSLSRFLSGMMRL
jgi:hypothetical protein